MVEIEHIQDIEKDQPAKSSAKEQKLKDPKDLTTETQDTDASEATEHLDASTIEAIRKDFSNSTVTAKFKTAA